MFRPARSAGLRRRRKTGLERRIAPNLQLMRTFYYDFRTGPETIATTSTAVGPRDRPPRAPIIYVPGNLDPWSYKWQQDSWRRGPLPRSSAFPSSLHGEVYVLDGVRFLGAALWMDYRLKAEASS